jgi:hypothetical protein
MARVKTNFRAFSDPGHGWLRVPYSELERLDIADKITRYSYQKGDNVFLEEDRDLTTFLEARKARNEPVKIQTVSIDRSSRIRSYESYTGRRFPVPRAWAYVSKQIEQVERTNIMTGKTFLEDKDTPYYLSPSSETYWSA